MMESQALDNGVLLTLQICIMVYAHLNLIGPIEVLKRGPAHLDSQLGTKPQPDERVSTLDLDRKRASSLANQDLAQVSTVLEKQI